jgi:PAS domain S-box-containing protein
MGHTRRGLYPRGRRFVDGDLANPVAGARTITRLEADTFRRLVETTSDYAIFMLDPEGHVMSWNAGAHRVNGYRPEEIIGKHFSIFYPREKVESKWPDRELEAAAREGRFEDEGWRIRKDGSRFWANVVITALRDDEGRLLGFGKVSRDMTDRRAAELALKESEERFRMLIDSTLDYAIFMLNPQGYIASWNPGAQRLKGYAADEIIGKHFSVFYTPEALSTNWPAYELKEAARVGRFEDEGWRVRKDGTRFWANVVISALRGSDGTLRGFGKVTRDMTERKAQEERVRELTVELEARVVELATANRELAQKSSENESFVYSVSHDLRSPLVNLQGFSQELSLTSTDLEKLLTTAAIPADVRDKALSLLKGDFAESIGFIRNAVRHLGSIIDGLLRLSRLGRVEYEIEPVDMNAVVADILSAMHSTIESSGARIAVSPLPVVMADRNAVGQVVANIVGNALKCFDAHRPGLIEISADQQDPPVFSIRDNGVGIPREFQPKIFKVFQQVHQSPSRGEGMGLAIVRRIVERHGGRVWFESAAGVGTTFFFVVGREASAAARAEESSPPRHD